MQQLTGGALLNFLHEKSLTGIPCVHDAMTRLLYHCLRALYNVMGTWLLYGRLNDRSSEFFVKEGSTPETFVLDLRNLPSFFTATAAETVVFIGKSVRVLQDPAAKSFGTVRPDIVGMFRERISRLQNMPSFHALSFESEMAKMRAVVANDLYQLVVVGANLKKHFRVRRAGCGAWLCMLTVFADAQEPFLAGDR